MSTASLWDALSSRWQPGLAVPLSQGGALRSQGHAGTVLLVDDEPLVLEVMAEALEELGWSLILCGDAGEGLGALSLLLGPAVLVVDVSLRGVSGPALADAFRDRRPDGAVVFTSGIGDGEALVGAMRERDALLRKPFGGRELRRAVARAATLATAARAERAGHMAARGALALMSAR